MERARVTDAQTKVMEIAGTLERCYTVTNDYRYKNSTPDACVIFTDLESDDGYYDISATAVGGTGSLSATGYRVVANASGKGPVACNTLWVESTGVRGPDGNNDCW
ncbi:type IV pilin protein [Halomonas sp.]